MKVHKPSDDVLVIERVYRASQERLYQAWTDPTAVAAWFGPEGMTTEVSELRAQPGGAYAMVMRSDESGEEHHLSGEFIELTPPSRVLMTWKWKAAEQSTLVEVVLSPHADGTLLRLTHSKFPSADVRDNHEKGWTSSFNCLDSSL